MLQEAAINPYNVPAEEQRITMSRIIDNAIRSTTPVILMLLLQQAPITNYLKNLPRDSLTFTLVNDKVECSKNVRAACELIRLASIGNTVPPVIYSESPLKRPF